MNIDKTLQRVWKTRNPAALALWPLGMVYCAIVEIRRLAYQTNVLKAAKYDQPVIVVGNLTVGGTGKTPFVIWLAKFLKAKGLKPGVVSRGYGRKDADATILVEGNSNALNAGDEPVLIARRAECPVAVSSKRSEAIDLLLASNDCNIFISDDGLQHLALQADLEICLIDGNEQFGNRFCLPAGPLRERTARLNSVDFIVINGQGDAEYSVNSQIGSAINLVNRTTTCSITSFREQQVNVVAGIRNPDRFEKLLNDSGIQCTPYWFPDHHLFNESDFNNFDKPDIPLLMTEKDAVKCEKFAHPNWWEIALDIVPNTRFIEDITSWINTRFAAH